eukprot:TRINITY_DN8096_c1_g4_i1.p1 TRINITY_DN8096_c1_g4~~TRINITY_DN8096_c1_g4_i1.p1  ORF type:complete len:414 (+),score=119.69 TRINITY_DN8096_c1_g4_i1:79-1242(+)
MPRAALTRLLSVAAVLVWTAHANATAKPRFRPGAATLYQDLLPTDSIRPQRMGLWSIDLNTAPCCAAQLLWSGDAAYGFGDSQSVGAVQANESIAVAGDRSLTPDRFTMRALRSEDGMDVNVTVANGVSPVLAGAVGTFDGQSVGMWVRSNPQVADGEELCYGRLHPKSGQFEAWYCQDWQGANVVDSSGRVLTSWWDPGRQRMVMVVSNCAGGTCPQPLRQFVAWVAADGSGMAQFELPNADSGDLSCWYPRKCDVAPDGNYVCLLFCEGYSGYARLAPGSWEWGDVMTSPLWSFSVVDGYGVGLDTGMNVWAFDAVGATKPGTVLYTLGALQGEGVSTSGAGRMWSFGQRSAVSPTLLRAAGAAALAAGRSGGLNFTTARARRGS